MPADTDELDSFVILYKGLQGLSKEAQERIIQSIQVMLDLNQ